MNKPTIKEVAYSNQYAYALRKEALAYRHASRMIAASHPASDLVKYFRREMRLSAVLMVQHAKAIIHITVK